MCGTEFQQYSTVQWSALVHNMQHAVHARRVPAAALLGVCHLEHWLQLPLLRCTFLPTKASNNVHSHKRSCMLMLIWKIRCIDSPVALPWTDISSFPLELCCFVLCLQAGLQLQSRSATLSPIMHNWPWQPCTNHWQPSANHSVHLWCLI